MRSLIQANSVNCKAPLTRERFEPFSVPLNCASLTRHASSQHSHFMEAQTKTQRGHSFRVRVASLGRWTGVRKPAPDPVPSSSRGLSSRQALPGSAEFTDRVPGGLPRIFHRDEDARKAETIGETEGPECWRPLSTPPAGVRTPVLVVAPNPTATSHAGAAARVCNRGGRSGGSGLAQTPGSQVTSACIAPPPATPAMPWLRQQRPSAGARSQGSGRGRGGPAVPAPYATAVCTHVISSNYPGLSIRRLGA